MRVRVKLEISDREALASIRGHNLRDYLEDHGWLESGPWSGGRATLYLKGSEKGSQHILVPARHDTLDYAERTYDAVSTLSTVEGRSQLDIFCDLVDEGTKDSISILMH